MINHINNKKQILLIIPSLDRGGTENVCINLFKELINKSKYDVNLLVLNKKRNNYFYEEINKKYREKITFVKKYNWLTIFKELIKLTSYRKLNTIILFNNETAFLIIFIKFFFKRSFKIILRVNNSLKNKIKYSSNFLKAYKKKIYYYFSLVFSDLIIAQSNEMANEIEDFCINKRKIKVIYNPISNNFKKIATHKKKDNYFLFVGSLTFKKNPIMLLKAYKLLKINTTNNFKLKIIGKGDKYQEIKNFICVNNLSKEIEIINEISQKNLQDIYLNAYCLIICSRYEGFPNVAIESLYCGTPIMAYKDIGGINELINPSVNGLMIEKYTIESYFEGLKKIIKIKFDRNKVKDSSKKFYVNNIIKDYEELL